MLAKLRIISGRHLQGHNSPPLVSRWVNHDTLAFSEAAEAHVDVQVAYSRMARFIPQGWTPGFKHPPYIKDDLIVSSRTGTPRYRPRSLPRPVMCFP